MEKPEKKSTKKLFNFRCEADEIEQFREAAEREGFSGNVSAWILWHLRRIVRESRDNEKK